MRLCLLWNFAPLFIRIVTFSCYFLFGLLQIQIGKLDPVSKKPVPVARHVISVPADSTPDMIVAAAVRQMSDNDKTFGSSCSFTLSKIIRKLSCSFVETVCIHEKIKVFSGSYYLVHELCVAFFDGQN